MSARVPHPDDYDDPLDRSGCRRALEYMDLAAGTPDHRHPPRPGVPRVVHQRPNRGPPGRGGRRGGALRGSGSVSAMVVPGSGPGEAPGRGGGPRPHLQGSRVRMAGRRLLHVPGDERRHPRARASAARRRRTATSRAGRGGVGAPTSSVPRWPPLRRSPATSSTCRPGPPMNPVGDHHRIHGAPAEQQRATRTRSCRSSSSSGSSAAATGSSSSTTGRGTADGRPRP